MRLVLPVLMGVLFLPVMGSADPFEDLVERAFRCVPMGGGDEIPTQGHQVPGIGVSIGLPLSWTAPLRTSRFDATVASPDGRTRVTMTRQVLTTESVASVIHQTERRHLGPDRQSPACVEAALQRYRVEGTTESSVRLHSAGLANSNHRRTTHALHFRVKDALVSVMVEARWVRGRPPSSAETDAILRGIELLEPPAGELIPSS